MGITLVPLAWLVAATFAASWQKIFSAVPRIGFLAQASQLQARLDAGLVVAAKIGETRTLIFNARLDAVMCGLFLVMSAVVLADSIRLWAGILAGSRDARTSEAPFVLSQWNAEEI